MDKQSLLEELKELKSFVENEDVVCDSSTASFLDKIAKKLGNILSNHSQQQPADTKQNSLPPVRVLEETRLVTIDDFLERGGVLEENKTRIYHREGWDLGVYCYWDKSQNVPIVEQNSGTTWPCMPHLYYVRICIQVTEFYDSSVSEYRLY